MQACFVRGSMVLLAVMIGIGCSGSGSGIPDAGTNDAGDAGTGPRDGASAGEPDAAMSEDAGIGADSGTSSDGGPGEDGGSPVRDGGAGPDGGSPGDSGAGPLDGGTPPDGGPSPDGGTPPDGGEPSAVCDEESPIELASESSVMRTVDTSQAQDDAQPPSSCVSSCEGNVPDTVLRYTPPTTGTLTAATTGNDSFDTVVSVYDACSGTGRVLACNDDTAAGSHSVAVLRQAEAEQPVFIAVDGCASDDVGEADLSVGLTPDAGSGGGAGGCDSPTPLQFFPAGRAEVAVGSGDTRGGSNELAVDALCGSDSGAPDHFYGLEVDLASDEGLFLTVEVTPRSPDFDPMINVFQASSCSDPNLERCANRRGPGEAETLNTALIESGTYVVAIDGANGTVGPYDITVIKELTSGG